MTEFPANVSLSPVSYVSNTRFGRRRRILTDDVFEYQVPSDDERDELADADVTVDVGRPGFWHARRELGVTQT